jgi:uncharacterized protein YwqG
MKVNDIELAKAIIEYEAVDCFIGQQVEFNESPAGLVSQVGGIFWGKRDESWPLSRESKPLLPWLQIVCSEMKDLYGPFYKKQLLTFFIEDEFDGSEALSLADNNEFVVREYDLGDNLVKLIPPDNLDLSSCKRVIWKASKDFPSMSKYYRLFSENVYNQLADIEDFEFENKDGIKINGWPSPLQSNQKYPGTFDLQIDVTDNFMYADSGIGFLKKSGGQWDVVFESC